MGMTPYGDITGDYSRRLSKEMRSASDVQSLMDEIDWYRKLIEQEIDDTWKKPGLQHKDKVTAVNKLAFNKDSLAKVRLKAMDLKKEWEKAEK